MQTGTQVVSSKIRYLIIQMSKTMGCINHHFNIPFVGGIGNLSGWNNLTHPVYHMGDVDHLCLV